ncbi:putative aldouronate transport system substrate-binding protein [Paenibacillus sp. 1_12]|uniref:extracellular solute-binding protein n=1 Tax=Paenibacillus sp. 1_12 TaxID=1566278 RepID=UPI0008E6B0C6|nr:extracellular solute-binding protein [Paenibacillus sp. 1_12]SFL25574.1 putative aldouronate transport system substrate-binding protein [Paenibacillus sp. 1_12]
MSNPMKRMVVPVLISAALVASAVGCTGRTDKKAESETPKSNKRAMITATIYDRGNIPSSEGTIENNKITKWINESGPVDVKFIAVPRAQSEQKLSTLFAGGGAPDLILEYAPQIKNPLIDQKQLRPISDMIDKYSTVYKALLQKYPSLKKAGTGADGQLYQFGRINETIPQRGLFIRTDWLKKLNLKIPKTTEELYQTAKAFAEQDPDGNGKKDTYGIAMSYNSGNILDEMFGVTYPGFIVQNNELIHGWDHIKAATEFKKKLYSEGLVDKDYLNDKNGSKAKQDFLKGKTGIYMEQFNVPIVFYNDYYVNLKKNVPNAEITVIPYPETPVGQFNPIFVNPIQMTAVVNAQVKDTEAVMKYVDFAASEKFMKTMYYGFEGVHSKSEPGKCPQVINLDKWKTEFNFGSGDFAMLASPTLAGKCYFGTEKLDAQNELQNQVKKMFEANSSFIRFDLPVAGPTHAEQMPQLPKELQQILTNTTKHVGVGEGDIWVKSILTPGYSPEQAKQDAIAAWNKAGGKQVDDWYKSFYANDKDKMILTRDIYDIFKEQRALQKK